MDRSRQTTSRDSVNWGRSYGRATGMRYDDVDEPPRRRTEPPYKISVKNGEPHARQRHTFEGIWNAREALTDHPDRVAVFATEGDFQDALRNMPTDPDAWWRVSADRKDAEVGTVHYQAILLGDTMDLTTCYPMRGREYDKAWLNNLLGRRRGKSSEAFWAFAHEVDDLWYELGSVKGFPAGASHEEEDEIARLRQDARDALNDYQVGPARTAIRSLKEAWDKIKLLAAARVAEAKKLEEARDKTISDTRIALNKAIDAKNVELAETLYKKMLEFKTFVSPPALNGLRQLGIKVVDG